MEPVDDAFAAIDPIGLVIGTEDAFALSFWVYVKEGRYLQLDDVVTVPVPLPDGQAVRLHGIVDTVRSRFEGARFDSDAFAASEQRLPVGVAHAAHVTVTRVEPEIFIAPPPGPPSTRAKPRSATKRSTSTRCLPTAPRSAPDSRATGQPIYGNLEFLDGTRGAHMNISGISGVATKTSYALFLLYSLLRSDALGAHAANTKAIIFNVKGEDLLWLDKPNNRLDDKARADYETLGPPRRPVPQRRHLGASTQGRRRLRPLVEQPRRRRDRLRLVAADVHPRPHARLPLRRGRQRDEPARFRRARVERWLDNPGVIAGPNARGELTFVADSSPIRDFNDLALPSTRTRTQRMPAESESTRQALDPPLAGRALRRPAISSARLSAEEEEEHTVRIARLGARTQVNVIDIHNLHDRAKRFVVGVIVKRLFEQKERAGARGRCVFLVLDELNKYAPREGWSPIKEVLLDIAERGRSLGIILIGAQQTASEVERRVMANCGVPRRRPARSRRGRRGEYGFLTDAAQRTRRRSSSRARCSCTSRRSRCRSWSSSPSRPGPRAADEVAHEAATEGSGLRGKAT